MPQVEFEPPIPVFDWAKTVHVLYHAAVVIRTVTQLAKTSPMDPDCPLPYSEETANRSYLEPNESIPNRFTLFL
jgi:hypothetical protein